MNSQYKLLKKFPTPQNDGKYCGGCGEYFTEKRIKRARQLCHACYASWMRQRAKWRKRHESVVITDRKSNLHRYIAEKLYGNFPFCHECGSRQWGWTFAWCKDGMFTGSDKEPIFRHVAIHIHHIDGEKTNNTPKNLIPLCGSCYRKEHYRMKRSEGVYKS